jgi:copper chaperone
VASESKTFKVEGMSCMHCVHAVKTAVGTLPGIGRVEVDLMGKQVEVVYDPAQVDPQAITAKITEAGYDVI